MLTWTTRNVIEVGKHSPTIFVKKSDNQYTLLRKFYDMICEIIVSKTVCEILLIFCRSNFTNNFMVKNNFSEPKNHQKLYISRSIYFLNKIPARRFVGLLCTNQLEIFFFEKKKCFQGLGAYFTTAKLLIWASIFPTKN